MAILTTIGLLAGGATALAEFGMGFQARKDAMEGLEEFERQTLINPYESIKPSLAAENTALNRISEGMANVRDVSSGMDAASALATLSVGNEQAGQQRQDVINNMMQIQNKIDFASAGAEMNLQDIKERRDEVDLASLQAQFASGTQDMFDGAMGSQTLACRLVFLRRCVKQDLVLTKELHV